MGTPPEGLDRTDPHADGQALPLAARPRVLVVDDDRLFLEQVEALLEQEGFDCVVEASGAGAMRVLEAGKLDLVLCDVALPGVDCCMVTERSKALSSRPAILLVTGLSEADKAVQRARGSGASVLFKPLDPSELGHTVAWLMHERHLRLQGLPASDLAALYCIATAVNGGSVSSPLFDRVLQTTLGALGGDSGSIMLASVGPALPRTLAIAASTGLKFDPARLSLEFGQGVAGWVAAQARPLRLVGSLDAYPQFRGMKSNPMVAESLVAPLLFRREVLGTISVNSGAPGRFGSEKLALLVSVAEVLAAALQRKRMEGAREHQDRLAVLGQLSASIAHELNNPLAGLKANTSVLSGMLTEPDSLGHRSEIQAIVLDMKEAVDRMESLASTLKETARRPTTELQEIDLDVLLARAEILVHPQFKHRVRLVLEPGSPQPVRADSGRITQILINLLVNAAQVVEKDGLVMMRSRAEQRWAIVEVVDNGPGIPDEVAAHLFEPFFTTKPEGEGTGLGLSISRQIAREYGGDLTFTTKAGVGSCFTLKLPAASEPALTRPTVLVVDDEPALLNAVDRVLRRGFKVLKAQSPDGALSLAAATTVDLIITDYSMPGRDGVSLVRALRERGVRAPAVLVTAVFDSYDIQAALRGGLLAKVISKPWSPATLLAEALALVRGPGAP